MWPDAALSVFLTITAWHWGTTDARAHGIQLGNLWGIGRGLLIVGAATGWQRDASAVFFQTIVTSTAWIELLLNHGGWLALLGLC
ncbi:MAG: hypothetical protein HC767_06695 [Akkermansiaceae bacterium]|nr:hypothetical protein [Akkermansiaceae bacterium]